MVFFSRFSCTSNCSSSQSNLSYDLSPASLLKAGLRPSIRSFNLFLYALFRSRKPLLIIEIFSQISSSAAVQADAFTHSLVLRTLIKSRKHEQAVQFVERSDFSPGNGLLGSLIRNLCKLDGNPEKGLFLLRDCARNRGFCPSAATFRCLLLSFSSRGKMEGAMEVLDLMDGENVNVPYPIDNLVCSSMIAGFSRAGKPALGLGFYERVRKIDGFLSNLITYTAVVDALCRDDRVPEACDLVRKMESDGLELDVVLYGCLINGFFRAGALMEGLRRHKLMIDSGMIPDIVSYTIFIDGFCKEGNVAKVLGVLNEMKKNGLEPNLLTYAVLIGGLCKSGKLEEAFWVLRKMEEMEIVVDEYLYSTLINAFGRKGDWNKVFCLLDEMKAKDIQVGTVTYNTVINCLCKFGRVNEANELSRCFSGDNFTYSTLLHGYSKEMDREGVMETKRRLENSRIHIDTVTCNVLIKALFAVKMAEEALLVYHEIPNMGLVADSVTYCTVIDECCKAGNIGKAVELFDEYKDFSSLPNAACHIHLIEALCKENMSDMAIEVFQDLAERNIAHNPLSWRIIMRTLFNQGNEERLLNFVHQTKRLEHKLFSDVCSDTLVFLCVKGCFAAAVKLYNTVRGKGMIFGRKSYYVLLRSAICRESKHLALIVMSDTLKAYGTHDSMMINMMLHCLCDENVDRAISLIKNMETKMVNPNISLRLIKALKREGRLLDAYNFLMESDERGLAGDVITYSTVVDGLCEDGYLEKALELCQSMQKKEIPPNIDVYNSVLKGLCLQGCLMQAFKLFLSLEHNNVQPTLSTYAILLNGLSKEGFMEDATQLLERMISKGIVPNVRIYNVLIYGYCSLGCIEGAQKFLTSMEEHGLQPDAFTVSTLISCCCRRGYIEDAMGFFREFSRQDVFPDFLGFMNLVKCLFAKGRMEEARGILGYILHNTTTSSLIIKAGDLLQVEALVDLVSIACEQGRIKEVIDILTEVGYVFFPTRKLNGNYSSEANNLNTSNSYFHTISDGRGIPCHIQSNTRSKSMDVNNVVINIPPDKVLRDPDHLKYRHCIKKYVGLDFDSYYSILAALCSRGKTQEANIFARGMLSAFDKCQPHEYLYPCYHGH